MSTTRTLCPTPRTAVSLAVNLAYGDTTCVMMFRAPQPVNPAEAAAIMEQATPRGYNEFKPSLLHLLPEDAEVTLAREYSVCVYVKGNVFGIAPGEEFAYGKNAKANRQFRADEISYDLTTDETRIWWD